VKKINWLLVLLVVMSLTPVYWFWGKDGVLINGLDTNFPLDPVVWFARRFYVWNGVSNMGVDFSSSVAGLFFHLIQVIPFYFGASLQLTEIVSMVFWFSAVVFAAYYCVCSFGKISTLSKILFVTIYAYNIYLFNTWENVKVSNLALVVSLPLFLGLLQRFKHKEIGQGKFMIPSALFGILASGSGINPAYFSVLVLLILIYLLVTLALDWGDAKRFGLGTLKSLGVLVGVNMFWILPLLGLMFFSGEVRDLADLGFTNWLASLSEHTSLVNVIRLQGAWDWYALDEAGFPLYIPYALNYFYNYPFIVFSYVLPVFVLVSLAFWQKRRATLYSFFVVILIVGVFMGTGLNGPTGSVYEILIKYFPFFSFYRSPWYIFTPFVVLAYAGLTALLFERFREYGRALASFFGIVFLLGYAFYSYPLITGKIFRLGRADSFVVRFPEYVWPAKDWISDGKLTKGRVLTYPDDDLESFEWGYRGTESILGLFSDQEFISPSFNVQNKIFKMLLDKTYFYLKRGDYDAAFSIFPYFGADTLLIKDDAVSLSGKLGEEIEKVGKVTKIGEWRFLERVNQKVDKVYVPEVIYENIGSDQSFSELTSYINFPAAIVWPGDSEIARTELYQKSVKFGEFENKNYESDPTGRIQTYTYSFDNNGEYYLALEKKGQDLQDVKVIVNEKIVLNESIENLETLLIIGPVEMVFGENKIEVVFPEGKNLAQTDNLGELFDTSRLREVDLPAGSEDVLVAFNDQEKEKRIYVNVNNFDPFSRYQFTFDYKYFYGSAPIIDLLQSIPSTPLKVVPINVGASMDWEKKEIMFDPAEIESKLEIIFRLPPKDKGGKSKAYFENLVLKKVNDNHLFFIEKREMNDVVLPKVEVKQISPVKYVVRASEVEGDFVLGFLESYSPEWKLIVKDGKVKPTHFSINGFANGWYVTANGGKMEFEIYYKRQNSYLLGVMVSLLTLAYAGLQWSRKRNQ